MITFLGEDAFFDHFFDERPSNPKLVRDFFAGSAMHVPGAVKPGSNKLIEGWRFERPG